MLICKLKSETQILCMFFSSTGITTQCVCAAPNVLSKRLPKMKTAVIGIDPISLTQSPAGFFPAEQECSVPADLSVSHSLLPLCSSVYPCSQLFFSSSLFFLLFTYIWRRHGNTVMEKKTETRVINDVKSDFLTWGLMEIAPIHNLPPVVFGSLELPGT